MAGASSRARLRRTLAVGVVLLVGSVVVALVLARRYQLDTAATLVGLVGGVPGLTGLWLAWAAYTADRAEAAGETELAEVADQLAAAVRRQWEDEAALRQLNDPYPLPVRWRPAPAALVERWPALVRLARSGAGWPPPPPAGSWAAGPGGLAGGDGDLPGLLERVPTGRLVVLGEPGAGKTMLTVRLVLDLLAARQPGGPVPLLVPLASWNPEEEGLRAWLERRLTGDYPGLGVPAPGGSDGSRARALLDAGLILAVLDGLDEIGEAVRARAIAGINTALRPGQRLVVTARAEAYRRTVSPPGGREVRLAGAAGIQLRPLARAVVADYLRGSAGGPAGAARWDELLAAWPQPVAQTLTTPLMATLARTVYNPRPGEAVAAVDGSPSDLLDPARFPTAAAVARHLFDGFIPAAYRPHPDPDRRCRWSAADAERWLVFLARYLDDTLRTTDLAWWRLVPALSARARAAARAAVGLLVGLVIGTVAGLVGGRELGLALGPAANAIMTMVTGTALIAGTFSPPRRAVRWHWPRGREIIAPLALGTGAGVAGGWSISPAFGLVGVLLGVVPFGFSGVSADLRQATGPGRLLRQDRVAFTVLTVGLGLVAGVAAGIAFGVAAGIVFAVVAVLFGGTIGMVETACSGYTLAVAALAARRRLPWRLMAFLADAHERRGVLRQVGATYQFRHVELQHRLAER